MVCNPDLFINNITDEQWSSFKKRYDSFLRTVRILAEYDEEMATIMNIIKETSSVSSDEEVSEILLQKKVEYIDSLKIRINISFVATLS